ncbi:translation initiation factor IF-2 [Streptomyces pharetrae]|uniref:translation initiation factor IF-2 n=1 Tax=Streptomyces pharetrae TaxID=291370 RepID=UPI003364A484
MAGKGSGGARGGTSFEGMSHEQMLAWLDQADSGTVQAAAQKLVAAAEEIRKIADELKIRPQWVEWKGEGADAFRTWAGDLANSALRLADFSGDSGKWLSQASGAIATAQAAVPRDESSTSANLAAARAHHNDPDAGAVAAKSGAELAALKAHKEKVRQEAAVEMRKLAQAYDLSSTQMDGLERPRFPPPPSAISIDTSEDLARPGTGRAGSATGSGTTSNTAESVGRVTGHATAAGRSEGELWPVTVAPAAPHPPETLDRPAHVQIDSVDTLPEAHRPVTGPGPTVGPTTPARPESILPPTVTGLIPPTSERGGGRTPNVSGGGGRPLAGGRTPFAPGREGTGIPRGRDFASGGPFPHGATSGTAAGRPLPGPGMGSGRGMPAAPGTVAGRPPNSGVMGGRPTGPAVTGGRPTGPGAMGGRPGSPGVMGGHPVNQAITGGRPTGTPAAGKPSGRLPSGTVVGGEPAAHRGSTGPVPVAGPTGPSTAARPGATTNTGRPPSTPPSGVVGGSPQRTGRAPARPGAPVPSAPTRGGISGGTPNDDGDRASGHRPARPSSGARQGRQQQTDRRNGSSATD